MIDIRYNDIKTKGDAIKALYGTQTVYLRDSAPMELADQCKEGCSHRLGIATGVRFYATDKDTGIRFSWPFDIEPFGASGSGEYDIDTEACRLVMRELRGQARDQFRAYLADCSAKVRARGDEYRKAAETQAVAAAILSDLASTP